jgi:hypothetical protein
MSKRYISMIAFAAGLAACGGGDKQAMAPGGARAAKDWPADDRSMCNWRGQPDMEVNEVAGTGAIRPNVRRVFRLVGDADHSKRQLVCREIDTNLDGIKDVVRTYNVKGEPVHEEADRNYDGKIDIWVNFADGKMAEVVEDENHDGKPDTWKVYVDGVLSRVKRDRNGDGKPDVWEMYARNGRLERMGVDDNNDGHVDRWDRDDQFLRDADEAERKAKAAMAAASASAAPSAGAPPATPPK